MYRLSRAPCLSATVLEGSRAAKRLFSSRADMERTITAGAMQTPSIMHACLTASPRGFPVRLRPSCGANRPAWCGGYRSGRPQPLRAIAAPVEPLELQTNEEIDFSDRVRRWPCYSVSIVHLQVASSCKCEACVCDLPGDKQRSRSVRCILEALLEAGCCLLKANPFLQQPTLVANSLCRVLFENTKPETRHTQVADRHEIIKWLG